MAGRFRSVELDDAVVDLQSRQRGEHVFGHFDHDAVVFDRGPSSPRHDIFDLRRHLGGTGAVGPLKRDAVVGAHRPYSDGRRVSAPRRGDPWRAQPSTLARVYPKTVQLVAARGWTV